MTSTDHQALQPSATPERLHQSGPQPTLAEVFKRKLAEDPTHSRALGDLGRHLQQRLAKLDTERAHQIRAHLSDVQLLRVARLPRGGGIAAIATLE